VPLVVRLHLLSLGSVLKVFDLFLGDSESLALLGCFCTLNLTLDRLDGVLDGLPVKYPIFYCKCSVRVFSFADDSHSLSFHIFRRGAYHRAMLRSRQIHSRHALVPPVYVWWCFEINLYPIW
jgi:hypothetical protein